MNNIFKNEKKTFQNFLPVSKLFFFFPHTTHTTHTTTLTHTKDREEEEDTYKYTVVVAMIIRNYVSAVNNR